MVDQYTKAVLTVIAVALSVIAIQKTLPQAKAQDDNPTHVVLDDVQYNAFQGITIHTESDDSNN